MARFVQTRSNRACFRSNLETTQPTVRVAGINEFVGNQTDFGGSDVPLSTDEHTKAQQRCGFAGVGSAGGISGPDRGDLQRQTALTSLTLDGADGQRKSSTGPSRPGNDPGDHGAQTPALLWPATCRYMSSSAVTSPAPRTIFSNTSMARQTVHGEGHRKDVQWRCR